MAADLRPRSESLQFVGPERIRTAAFRRFRRETAQACPNIPVWLVSPGSLGFLDPPEHAGVRWITVRVVFSLLQIEAGT